MAITTPTDPDSHTGADDDEDTNAHGVSSPAPAEGGDDIAPPRPGSPQG